MTAAANERNRHYIDFGDLIRAELTLLRAQWSAETRAEHEAEELAKQLDA